VRASEELVEQAQASGTLAIGVEIEEEGISSERPLAFLCYRGDALHAWGYGEAGPGWQRSRQRVSAVEELGRQTPPGCATYVVTAKAWSLPENDCRADPEEDFLMSNRLLFAATPPRRLRVDETGCSLSSDRSRAGVAPLVVFEINAWDVIATHQDVDMR